MELTIKVNLDKSLINDLESSLIDIEEKIEIINTISEGFKISCLNELSKKYKIDLKII